MEANYLSQKDTFSIGKERTAAKFVRPNDRDLTNSRADLIPYFGAVITVLISMPDSTLLVVEWIWQRNTRKQSTL
jgi:hypothetical protein